MFGTLGSSKQIYISLFNNKFYYDYIHFSQTCLFGREKHDAGVHWTPRDYSRVNILFWEIYTALYVEGTHSFQIPFIFP